MFSILLLSYNKSIEILVKIQRQLFVNMIILNPIY